MALVEQAHPTTEATSLGVWLSYLIGILQFGALGMLYFQHWHLQHPVANQHASLIWLEVLTLSLIISLFYWLTVLRRAANHQQQAREKICANIFQLTDNPLLMLDVQDHVLYASGLVCQLLGYTAAELCGLPWARIMVSESTNTAFNESTTADCRHITLSHKLGHHITFAFTEQRIPIDGGEQRLLLLREREKADEEIVLERTLLNALLDHSYDLVYFKDLDSRFIRVSRTVAQRAGIANPEDMIGKTDFDLFSLDHASQTLRDEQEIIRTGKPLIDAEERETWEGRGDTWVSTTKLPLHAEDGKLIGTFGISREITNRKRIEQTLEQERTLLATLIDTIPDLIFVKDTTGHYRRVNKALARRLGLSQTEVSGTTDYDFYPTQLADQFAEDDACVLRTVEPLLNKEELQVLLNGKQLWGSTTKMPILNTVGEIVGLLGISRDITALKNSELAQHQLASDLHAVIMATDELMACPTLDDLLSSAVALARERLHVEHCAIYLPNTPEGELAGTYGTDLDGQITAIPHLTFTDEASLQQLRQQWRDGGDTWGVLPGGLGGRGGTDAKNAWTAITPIGAPEGGAGVFVNDALISGNPLDADQQQCISLYCSLLGHLLRRRHAEDLLATTAQQLAYSNSELEQFAYIASHDLQEPLRMVGSYVQLLSRRYKGKLDEDADEFINYAVDGALRMKTLINDLLQYSRVGTHGKPFEPVSLDDLLSRVLFDLQFLIEDQHTTITHDPLPSVQGDPVQLAQLLQNLVGNAIKFHGEEAPRIHIQAEITGAMWRISVRDNGIGIDPQYADRIFIIFQRLHTQAEYSGTGIGLAVCKKIVERHGGHIWVESTLGAGTTMHFTLPMKESTVHEQVTV